MTNELNDKKKELDRLEKLAFNYGADGFYSAARELQPRIDSLKIEIDKIRAELVKSQISMRDAVLNAIQKFINSTFKYNELLVFLDKQKDFILQKKNLDNTDESLYNSIWDTIMDLQKKYEFAKDKNVVIGTKFSVMSLYNINYDWRVKRIEHCLQ